MKYIKLTLMITMGVLCLSRNGFAQKPTLQMGFHIPPEESKSSKNKTSELIAADDKEILVSDRTKKGSVITSYTSATLKKTGSFILDYPEIGGKDANWVKRLYHGENITSIYGFHDKKQDEFRVYGKITNRKNKVVKKEVVLMQSEARKKKEVGTLITKYSNDCSKLLIFREPAGKKYDNEKMEFVLYDNDLNKISEKKLSFPYKDKSIMIQNVLVTNDGHISVIAYWEATKQEIKEDPSLEGQATFKIFGVSEDNETLEEIELADKGYGLGTCGGIVYNDTSNLILYTGFYRDENRGVKKKKFASGANGIYYLQLNTETWKLDIQQFNPIDEKTMKSFFMGSSTSERAEKRAQKAIDNGRGFSNMVLKNIFYNTDGSIRVICQVEYFTQSCTTSSSGQRRCTDYYYNMQVLEFNLNGKGELLTSNVIPKGQVIAVVQPSIGMGIVSVSVSVDNFSRYLGHVSLMGEKNACYIYNDSEHNFNEKKVARKSGNNFIYRFDGSKKSRLCYVTFDSKGQITKKPLVDNWKQNIMINPGNSVKINPYSVITFGKIRKTKELVLLRISLDAKANKETE